MELMDYLIKTVSSMEDQQVTKYVQICSLLILKISICKVPLLSFRTSTKRIEAWWCILRKWCTEWWMQFFKVQSTYIELRFIACTHCYNNSYRCSRPTAIMTKPIPFMCKLLFHYSSCIVYNYISYQN